MVIDKKVVSLIDETYKEEAIDIIENLNYRKVNFEKLSKSKIYRSTFIWILNYKGFNYLAQKIYGLLNMRDIDFIEIEKMLSDANIIDKVKIHATNNIDGEILKYDKEIGINRVSDIRFEKKGYPLKIKYVSSEYRGFVNCEFMNEEDVATIRITIKIPPKIEHPIDIRETIYIYTNVMLYRISFEIKKDIKENTNYITEESIISKIKLMKTRTRRILGVYNLKKAIEESDGETIVNILNITKNKDVVLEVFESMYDIIIKKLTLKDMLEVLERYIDLSDVDIRLLYILEKFLIDYPIVKGNIVRYLEKLYGDGIITCYFDDIIEILGISSDKSLDYRKKVSGSDLKFNRDKLDSEEKIFKYLGNATYVYEKKMLYDIYKFYSNTGDKRALEIVMTTLERRNMSFKEFGITERDILRIFENSYDEIIKGKKILNILAEYIGESIEIRRGLEKNIRERVSILDGIDKYKFIDENVESVYKLSKTSISIRKIYVEYLVKTETLEIKDLKFLEESLNILKRDLLKEEKENIVLKIIDCYIKVEMNRDCIRYISYYLYDIDKDVSIEKIKKIIYKNMENENLIKLILTKIEVRDVEISKKFFKEIEKLLLVKNEYEKLIYLIKIYIKIKDVDSISRALLNYITYTKMITELEYKDIIAIAMEFLDEEKLKKIYIKLVRDREDMTSYIREKYFMLYDSNENKKKLSKDFIEGKLNGSLIAKEVALKENLKNKEKFIEILKIGSINEKISEISFNVLKEHFIEDKTFSKEICKIMNREKFNEIKNDIENYYKFKNDIRFRNIFNNFRIINRYKGNSVDDVIFENIFTKEKTEGSIFKDREIKEIVKRNFNKMSLKFEEILDDIIIIKEKTEDFKKENEFDIIFLINEIIKMQQILIYKNLVLKDFKLGDFKVYKEKIILCKFCNLEKYSAGDEKYIICKIKDFLLENFRAIENKNELIQNIVYKKIIKNDNIETYSSLKSNLDRICKNNKEDFNPLYYCRYLEDFDFLKDEFKKMVIDLIIARNDISDNAKKKIVSESYSGENREKYFLYLIKLFNKYYFRLSKEELRNVYIKIIDSIRNYDSLKKDYYDLIVIFLTGANKKCDISKDRLLQDVIDLFEYEKIKHLEKIIN